MRPMTRQCARLMLVSLATAIMCGAGGVAARAQEATTVELSVRNHRFEPANITVPAGKPVTLRIRNLDATPMEFESESLRVEKIIPGNSEGVIRLRPLQPGSYSFFDEFNQATGRGALVAR